MRKTALLSAALASLAALAPLQAQHLSVKPAGRHWQAVILPGADTLRFTIWVPQGLGTSNGAAKVPLLLATHFGGRVTPYMGGEYMDMLVVPALADLGAVIVAPDGGADPRATAQSVEDPGLRRPFDRGRAGRGRSGQ